MFQNNQNSLKVHFDNQRKIQCSLELSDVNYLLKIVVFLELGDLGNSFVNLLDTFKDKGCFRSVLSLNFRCSWACL